jgi:hypothetical protein
MRPVQAASPGDQLPKTLTRVSESDLRKGELRYAGDSASTCLAERAEHLLLDAVVPVERTLHAVFATCPIDIENVDKAAAVFRDSHIERIDAQHRDYPALELHRRAETSGARRGARRASAAPRVGSLTDPQLRSGCHGEILNFQLDVPR